MATTFSHPKDWKCLEELCSKFSRNIGQSKIIRIAIEEHNKFLSKKSNQSITDFANKYAFDLESDVMLWKVAVKAMTPIEISELSKLLKKREGLVTDELIKRAR